MFVQRKKKMKGLLRFQDIENDVSQVICHDFLKDTTINANTATFFMQIVISIVVCRK